VRKRARYVGGSVSRPGRPASFLREDFHLVEAKGLSLSCRISKCHSLIFSQARPPVEVKPTRRFGAGPLPL
jgi:hypothetical protein